MSIGYIGPRSALLTPIAGAEEDVEPDLATFGGGLAGMDEENTLTEGSFEDFDQLASEGDFGNKKDGGFAALEGFRGELEIDIGFTATSNASKKRSVSWGLLEALEGFLLGRIEVDEGQFEAIWRIWGFRGSERGVFGGRLSGGAFAFWGLFSASRSFWEGWGGFWRERGRVREGFFEEFGGSTGSKTRGDKKVGCSR